MGSNHVQGVWYESSWELQLVVHNDTDYTCQSLTNCMSHDST